MVGIGAGLAALGVLLDLIPGTALAMAREREFPHWFAHIDATRSFRSVPN